jgi:ElaB/YqjD/DUF883 family membrane-anchored ribosome-binding protein
MVNKKNSTKISGIRQRTHKSVDNIMDKAQSIGESGKGELIHLKEKATTMNENFDGYIRKNPEKSVLIAAGIGAVISAMMRRRH